MSLENIVDLSKKNGWHIETYDHAISILPDFLKHWYTPQNSFFIEFCKKIKILESKDQTVWFLTAQDYNGTSDSAFKWDEFRSISLEYVSSQEEKHDIIQYWNKYLPVCISVKSGYSYAGIDATGNVIIGGEPEFENPSEIDVTLYQLMSKIISGEYVIY